MMNYSAVGKILGLLLLLLTAGMILPLIIAVTDFFTSSNPYQIIPLQGILSGIVAGLLISMTLLYVNRNADTNIGKSEAILLVFLSWFVGAIVAAMPFYFWAEYHLTATEKASPFTNFINCLFETVSGLTTTGASILTDISAIPDALLFWRALIQWYGGLGIVVLFVAILPMISGGNKKLFSAEATGISKDGSTPKIQETARSLWIIYVAITALQVIIMKILDPSLSLFTAVTFAFSTAATAGFSIFNESAGGMLPSIQWVIIIFMVIAGVNYGLYYQLVRGKWRDLIFDTEFICYISILAIASLLISINISDHSYFNMLGEAAGSSLEQTIRDATFQVVSIQTTTGFSNADFNLWPLFSQYILLGIMFVGGCGGSTGGGVKVSRIVTCFRLFISQLEKVYRPSVIRPIKVGKTALGEEVKITIMLHFLAIIVLSFVGAILLILFENDIDSFSAFSASVATLNNIGPGFSLVGATQNYSWLSNSSKSVLVLWMLIGRLEVFTVLVIFTPRFWKQP